MELAKGACCDVSLENEGIMAEAALVEEVISAELN
jgi:hypothetical protein